MLKLSTLKFLQQLNNNNNRAWFNEQKETYLDAKEDFETLIQEILLELGKLDPAYDLLEAKKCMFRIYRDIRFSKDKTPYKVHFAAGISKGEKRLHFPGFYLHIQPGKSYVGGGIWHPDREILSKIRQEIDYNTEDFLSILKKSSFENTFGSLSQEDKLKRPPKGYERDNPAIEYLKLRSFTTSCIIEEKDLTSSRLVENILKRFKELIPFVRFLEVAVDN